MSSDMVYFYGLIICQKYIIFVSVYIFGFENVLETKNSQCCINILSSFCGDYFNTNVFEFRP